MTDADIWIIFCRTNLPLNHITKCHVTNSSHLSLQSLAQELQKLNSFPL